MADCLSKVSAGEVAHVWQIKSGDEYVLMPTVLKHIFSRSLAKLNVLRQPLRNRRVLLLGAGGAVRGALLPFLQAAPLELVIVNREPTELDAIADLVVRAEIGAALGPLAV